MKVIIHQSKCIAIGFSRQEHFSKSLNEKTLIGYFTENSPALNTPHNYMMKRTWIIYSCLPYHTTNSTGINGYVKAKLLSYQCPRSVT